MQSAKEEASVTSESRATPTHVGVRTEANARDRRMDAVVRATDGLLSTQKWAKDGLK